MKIKVIISTLSVYVGDQSDTMVVTFHSYDDDDEISFVTYFFLFCYCCCCNDDVDLITDVDVGGYPHV